jgi:signal transduction histidine kinase
MSKGDPYAAVLQMAQHLQTVEDKRGEIAVLLYEFEPLCRQLMNCHKLTSDEKFSIDSVLVRMRDFVEALYQNGLFELNYDIDAMLSRLRMEGKQDE